MQYFHCLKSFNVVFLLKSITNAADNHINLLDKKIGGGIP